MEYAIDDATETERLAAHLSGSTFYLTQMVPMPYGQGARTGPAAKIESLFVRGYLHARHSLPRADFGSQVVGGYTDVFVTGVVGPVVYADVESLYPSIMLNYDVQPQGDALGPVPPTPPAVDRPALRDQGRHGRRRQSGACGAGRAAECIQNRHQCVLR